MSSWQPGGQEGGQALCPAPGGWNWKCSLEMSHSRHLKHQEAEAEMGPEGSHLAQPRSSGVTGTVPGIPAINAQLGLCQGFLRAVQLHSESSW